MTFIVTERKNMTIEELMGVLAEYPKDKEVIVDYGEKGEVLIDVPVETKKEREAVITNEGGIIFR